MRRPAKNKKAARKGAKARRPVKKKPVRTKKKVATRAVRRGPAKAKKKSTAKRRVAKKRPVAKKRSAAKRRPVARKRAAAKQPSARPKLRVVKLRRPKTPPPPAFPQTSGATPKQVYLFDLVRARAAVLAAIQGLSAYAADKPMAEGKWSVRLTVIHLIARDRARLHEIDAAVVGKRASWIGSQEQDWARMNAAEMAPLSSISWDEALRLLQSTRQKVTEAVESIPEDPPHVWAAEHPLMEMLAGLPRHDRHHADIIKRWREAVPSTP